MSILCRIFRKDSRILATCVRKNPVPSCFGSSAPVSRPLTRLLHVKFDCPERTRALVLPLIPRAVCRGACWWTQWGKGTPINRTRCDSLLLKQDLWCWLRQIKTRFTPEQKGNYRYLRRCQNAHRHVEPTQARSVSHSSLLTFLSRLSCCITAERVDAIKNPPNK